MGEALVDTVAKAIRHAEENPVMLPCPRCEGKGYHHGFGEHGYDPDWCIECGGAQYVQDPLQAAREAIAAMQEHNPPSPVRAR